MDWLFGESTTAGFEAIGDWIKEWAVQFTGIAAGEIDSSDGYSFIVKLGNGLPFAIPEQIFVGIDSLTRVVGYIMPLRLYLPIIILILGYWLVLILFSVFKATLNIFTGTFFGVGKK